MIASPPNLAIDNAEMIAYWNKVAIDYARLIPHYEPFISPGDLVFDVGAEKGAYTFMFRSLGARVIAVEPLAAGDAKYVRELVWKYRDDPLVTILPVALSDKLGSTTLKISHSAGPYLLPSIDKRWVESSLHAKFYGSNSEDVIVPTLTLDDIIRHEGVPRFVKVDCEGAGHLVIAGLSVPVPALSAELHKDWLWDTKQSAEHLSTLGRYEFNFCMGTGGHFEFAEWCGYVEMLAYLENRLTDTDWGDWYGRLISENGYA